MSETTEENGPQEGDLVTITGTPGRWIVEARSFPLYGYDDSNYRIRCRPVEGGGEPKIFDAHLATVITEND